MERSIAFDAIQFTVSHTNTSGFQHLVFKTLFTSVVIVSYKRSCFL